MPYNTPVTPTGTAFLNTSQTFTKGQAGAIVPLAYAATIAWSLAAANNFSVTLTGNAVLGLPTDLKVGQSGIIIVTQGGAGGNLLTYNAVFDFTGSVAPVLSVALGAKDSLAYYVDTLTSILIGISKAWGP